MVAYHLLIDIKLDISNTKKFHLINFFKKTFHIMYLHIMAANNGEQDCEN